MTEKTTPELPFTLGTSTGYAKVPLTVEEVLDSDHRRAGHISIGRNWYDPAELMRNLAPFVPEVEPVAWQASGGLIWHVLKNGVLRRDNIAETSTTLEDAQKNYGPLTALYARPPATAEPASAPSVAPNGLSLTWEGMTWVRGDVADSVSDRLTAEGKEARDKVTKLQAALDAAEAQNRAERNTVAARLAEDSARSDLARAAEEYAESKRELFAARTAAARARHAVEAEASEEAGS